MPEVKIEKYRKKLLAEKAKLEAEQARLNDHGGESMDEYVSEGVDFDVNHPGDQASQLFEREKDEALTENVKALVAQINDALTKMDNGTYGACDRCGKQIADARLDAVPYAVLCLDCQNRAESL